MAVNFNDDTWKYISSEIEKLMNNALSVCTNHDKTYKELLRAQGSVATLKTLINLPQVHSTVAATTRGKHV